MARKVSFSALESRSARLRLKIRRRPYSGPQLARGIALMYRRNKTNGTWVLKASDGHGSYWTKGFALADDFEDADAKNILTFYQAHYGRCVVHGNTVLTEEVPVYSAVAMAGLGWLPDTLLSRSIIIRMRRRLKTETVEPFRQRIHVREGQAIGRRLAVWAKSVLKDTEAARPAMPAGVEDRQADAWEPLLVVADLVSGEWPHKAREAACDGRPGDTRQPQPAATGRPAHSVPQQAGGRRAGAASWSEHQDNTG
jgi:hypothetical protein